MLNGGIVPPQPCSMRDRGGGTAQSLPARSPQCLVRPLGREPAPGMGSSWERGCWGSRLDLEDPALQGNPAISRNYLQCCVTTQLCSCGTAAAGASSPGGFVVPQQLAAVTSWWWLFVT